MLPHNSLEPTMSSSLPQWALQRVAPLDCLTHCTAAAPPSFTRSVALVTDERMASHRPVDDRSLWQAERPERLLDTIAELTR